MASRHLQLLQAVQVGLALQQGPQQGQHLPHASLPQQRRHRRGQQAHALRGQAQGSPRRVFERPMGHQGASRWVGHGLAWGDEEGS
jgi:hypothetical protein